MLLKGNVTTAVYLLSFLKVLDRSLVKKKRNNKQVGRHKQANGRIFSNKQCGRRRAGRINMMASTASTTK